MELFELDSSILPQVTLMYRDTTAHPHKNIRRILDEYIFYLVIGGELHFNEAGENYTLRAGETFLFEPGKLHFGTRNSTYQLYYIHFRHPKVTKREISREEWAERARGDHRKWITTMDHSTEVSDRIIIPKRMSFGDGTVMHHLCQLLEKAIVRRQNRLENHDVLTACAVDEILIVCYRQLVVQAMHRDSYLSTGLQRINDVIAFLNANYPKKLTGSQIEEQLSYNFDYLNQLFRRHLDTTVFKMLESIRIKHAKEYLLSRDWNVALIAEMVGFQNESYFSKVFKQYTGFSPTQYRSMHQKR